MGVHYTPSLLARFLAERLVSVVCRDHAEPLRVLDPACGDGVLLEALLTACQEAGMNQCEISAVDADPGALGGAAARLARFEWVNLHLIPGDFLRLRQGASRQRDLWEPTASPPGLEGAFDIALANPPYVRTQILGAQKCQQLATRFGLSGRCRIQKYGMSGHLSTLLLFRLRPGLVGRFSEGLAQTFPTATRHTTRGVLAPYGSGLGRLADGAGTPARVRRKLTITGRDYGKGGGRGPLRP
jgi:hypothetical protein